MSSTRGANRQQHDEVRVAETADQQPLLGRLNAHGFRLLMAADVVVIAVALVLPLAVGVAAGVLRLTWPISYYVWGYVAALVVHFVSFYFGGLYEREQRLGSRPVLPRIVSMAIGAMLLVVLVQQFVSGVFTEIRVLPLSTLPYVPLLVSVGLAGNRRISRALRDRREGLPRVLLVGVPDDVNLAREHIDDVAGTAEIVGTTTTVDELLPLQERTGASDVLVVTSRLIDDAYPEPLATLEARGVNVLRRISAQDTLLGLSGVREVAGLPFVVLARSALPSSRARFKRTIELLELLVTLPIWVAGIALIALYVLVTAGRPVFYWQERVGMDGRPFRMVKFRTMTGDAERDGRPVLAGKADARVVPSLAWLRRTRLDELPNLWNVVRGEMSIVGPRPERPQLTEQFEAVIPGYDRRHEIPPGLTGLAQVHGRYHTDPEYKLGYDLQYLVNWSPVLDLQIQLRTIWVMVTGRL